ncbi:acyl-CoA dehydrogenase family protein [Microbulbifer agarilyticus]|uniref:acyl-CoA dehydrogenase family protein n=1 Tax=Microbulbifer agarilyticus TaxID=260552 RepID=UPI001C96CC12|nr:acyl-CoA dehydrogenase family protein [Microbulbifer agarilyticus]MBY6189863.1 acyl-CoA dehydrogenase family protein [Microbulbifer agarilyticus]
MDLSFSQEELAFQQEVHAFLQENLPAHIVEATRNGSGVFVDKDIALEWQGILAEKGWAVPQWPVEHGGTGWTATQKYLFSKECYHAGAPMLIPLGLLMLAPVIMAFGSEEQKAEYLPKMLSGEHYWCQGYSEPGAGSDLASLKLKAEADGNDYLLNGSKIWTTHAHLADHIFCLVRTDSQCKPQHGISFLLVDMRTPGITVEPIVTMAGDHEVNQVFFDNVRVPQSNRIGEENKGWTYAKYLLEFERGGGFSGDRIRHELNQLKDLIADVQKSTPGFDRSGSIARKVARIDIDLKALEIIELRILSSLSSGGAPGPESSVMKLTYTRIEQAVNELAVEVIGYQGIPMDPVEDGSDERPDYISSIVPRYLNNRAASIFGGSQEVQRNIVSKFVLGL